MSAQTGLSLLPPHRYQAGTLPSVGAMPSQYLRQCQS